MLPLSLLLAMRAASVTSPHKKDEDRTLTFSRWKRDFNQPVFMHPLVFISGVTVLGLLFAVQEWIDERMWGYHIKATLLLRAWGVQYFLWGVLCWVMWITLRDKINNGGLRTILLIFVPLGF